jgi:hypothetical protein
VLNSDGSFTYTPTTYFSGTDSFSYKAVDSQGGSDPVTVTLNVAFVNQRPSFSAANPPVVNENAGQQTVANFATFSPGAANESGQSVLAYAVSNISNPSLFQTLPTISASGTLSYTPAANACGTSTFTVTVRDSGGTANGGVDTSLGQTFTLTVNQVNQAPIISAPTTASVNQNGSITFSSTDGNAISVSDADSNGAVEQVALTATHGTLSLATTAGVSIISGASGTAALTVTGTIMALNAALNGLAFSPTNGYSGAASISLSVSDLGNTGIGGPLTTSAAVAVTVNPTASAVLATLKIPQPIAVPGQPMEFRLSASGGSATAPVPTRSSRFCCVPIVSPRTVFTYRISFGDGDSRAVLGGGTLVLSHVYTRPGTFTVTLTATNQSGKTSVPVTQTVQVKPVVVEPDPFNPKKTSIVVGGTCGNDKIIFTKSGCKAIAVTLNGVAQGVFNATGPLIVFGQGGHDAVREDPKLNNPLIFVRNDIRHEFNDIIMGEVDGLRGLIKSLFCG